MDDGCDGGHPASPKLPRHECDRLRGGGSTTDSKSTVIAVAGIAVGAGRDDDDDDDGEGQARGLSMEMTAFDDTMRLNDEDMNLFEWFTEGEDCPSAALAYLLLGGANVHVGRRVASITTVRFSKINLTTKTRLKVKCDFDHPPAVRHPACINRICSDIIE